MSSALHTVIRAESFTGAGKVRAWMRRQSVDLEMGTNASTWGWRRNPVSGKTGVGGGTGETAVLAAGLEIVLGMI